MNANDDVYKVEMDDLRAQVISAQRFVLQATVYKLIGSLSFGRCINACGHQRIRWLL